MSGFVKTLQHKASRSRLRKISPQVDTNVPLPDLSPTTPTSTGAALLSTSAPTTGSSASEGKFFFWKKRDASPAPEGSRVRRNSSNEKPKPILNRRGSRGGDQSANGGGVRFTHSPKERGAALPPPSAFHGASSPNPSSPQLEAPGYSFPSPSVRSSSVPPATPVTPIDRSNVVSPVPIHSMYNSQSSGAFSYSPASSSSSAASTPPSLPVRTSSVARRSSRPSSRAYSQRSIPTSNSGPIRPASVLSNAPTVTGGTRRRSSRPQQPGSIRTRMSITSIHAVAPPVSPFSTSPTSCSPASSSHDHSSSYFTASSHGHQYASGLGPIAGSPSSSCGSTAAAPSPSVSPAPTVTRAPVTPPRPMLPTIEAEDESGLPMFNVIPATPGHDDEAPRVESAAGSRPGSAQSLASMPEEEDEEEEIDDVRRLLNFDDDNAFHSASPRLDDAIELSQGSPIQLELTPLDELESEDESSADDSHEVHTAEEHEEPIIATTAPLVINKSPLVVPKDVEAPPRGPKSPARQNQSLYQAHDDGRSISRSLAELAALACDLPSMDGVDLELAAAHAAGRFDSPRVTDELTPSKPVQLDPITTATAPATPPSRTPVTPSSATAPATPSRRKPVPYHTYGCSPGTFEGCPAPNDPLPPSPPFISYPSLPSLMSHDSMPSSASGASFPSSISHASFASASEPDQALNDMLMSLSAGSSLGLDLPVHSSDPSTPKIAAKALGDDTNPGLGLGLELAPSAWDKSPSTPGKTAVEELVSSNPGSPLPPSPPLRVHRMSAAAAHPHRVALYGTPVLYQRDSYASTSTTISTIASIPGCHVTSASYDARSSLSSLSLASDISDDDLMSASIVALNPNDGRYIIGREDAHSHEVGVAY